MLILFESTVSRKYVLPHRKQCTIWHIIWRKIQKCTSSHWKRCLKYLYKFIQNADVISRLYNVCAYRATTCYTSRRLNFHPCQVLHIYTRSSIFSRKILKCWKISGKTTACFSLFVLSAAVEDIKALYYSYANWHWLIQLLYD